MASDIIESAIETWSKAEVVYQPSPRSATIEAVHLVNLISGEHPELEDNLIELTRHEHQLVSAYSLLTLEKMGSSSLADLDEAVLDRREKISLRQGSFANSMDLGGLARQIKKRYCSKLEVDK